MNESNCYHDRIRAEAYATLEFPGTYYLAYRDLPEIIAKHQTGRKALDFGCGAGRSTRFLRQLGFDVIGVDVAPAMLDKAREIDPEGDYRLIASSLSDVVAPISFDLITAIFTFDNIPTWEKKTGILRELRNVMKPDGCMVQLVSAPEIYLHEWTSFTTKDFPENRNARCGDKVKIIMTDVPDRRPVEDIFWTDACYREVFARAGLNVVEKYAPLGREDEPFSWVNETRIAPWSIYVLQSGE